MLVDILGWTATGVVVLSFTAKEMKRLRMWNAIGTLLWIGYGVWKNDWPVITVNILILLVHLKWLKDK